MQDNLNNMYSLMKEIDSLKVANKVVSNFDYSGLVLNKPKAVKNGMLNLGLEISILDFILDIGKAAIQSEIVSKITSFLHPAEYNYSKEILSKISEIEKNIEKLVQMEKTIAYQNALKGRRDLLINLSTVTNSYFVRYCDLALAGKPSEDLLKVVEEWSGKICNGTNVYYVVENLLKMYINESVVLNKSYPDIYDELGYYAYPWQSNSYAFRQALREEDEYSIMSALVLTQAFFTSTKDQYHLDELKRLTAAYKDFMTKNTAELSPYPICQIPGAEVTFDRNWEAINWQSRLQQAKDGKWNLKEGKIRNKVYYQDHPEKYCPASVLMAIYSYYGKNTVLEACLSKADLVIDGAQVSGFIDVPYLNNYVVQGRYDWDRRAIIKNKDKFKVQCYSMCNLLNGNTEKVVAEGCNFTSGIVPPQDYNPPMKCTNVGHEVAPTGMFKIIKSGR